MSLSLLLLLMPLFGAAVAISQPERNVGPVAAIMTLVQVGVPVAFLWNGFEISEQLQQDSHHTWISELGVSFSLGIDGLSVFMLLLTILSWIVATFAASRHDIKQPRMFYAMLALAETGTLGAFLAQDLILFILFFDLLLIPFYFLIGIWGGGDRRAATTKFMIYTLAGSLLMFVAAIGLAVTSATQNDSGVSFAFADLLQNPVSAGAQKWVFAGFALALLVKMPLPPLHGWMPDTYRSAPLPVLIPLSAVVAKLGAYGFLRVVLPQLPAAVTSFQNVMLVLALAGIVYGSVMAFMQDDVRLVVGYSSIAQIGFVAVGIFALDPKGVQGAVLQMLNHGVVVVGLFLIVGFLATRSGGYRLSRMGGIAANAPLLAALFLIVSLATLAMPGSANFVGELYILFGAFDGAFVYGAVATIGVVLAAVYMIRFFQRAMHGRAGSNVNSRELSGAELGLLLPAVLVIVAMAVYPQFVVERIEPAADQALVTIEMPGAETIDRAAADEAPIRTPAPRKTPAKSTK